MRFLPWFGRMPINPVSTASGPTANAAADPNPVVTPPLPSNEANFGVRQIYSAPVSQPSTFQRYSSSYYPQLLLSAGPVPLPRPTAPG